MQKQNGDSAIGESPFFVEAVIGLLVRNLASLLDASLLTGELTQVEDTSTTYNTDLIHLDLVDVGRVEREDTLNTHAVRHLADGEHLGLARALDLDYHTTEALQTLLITLDDFVRYGDRVTSLERRYVSIRLRPHLLVYELDDCIFVHCCNMFFSFTSNIPAVPKLPYRGFPRSIIPRSETVGAAPHTQ